MDKAQANVLKEFGIQGLWSVKEIKTVPRATFYTKDGRELPNLPADAYHLQRYLARGFTLTPPQSNGEFKCEDCGKTFSKTIALEGHKRTHQKSNKEVN